MSSRPSLINTNMPAINLTKQHSTLLTKKTTFMMDYDDLIQNRNNEETVNPIEKSLKFTK